MAALPAAQAAMDAHRGVAALAKHGLAFLRSLAVANANKVSWWACFGQPPCVVDRMHVCPVHPALVHGCVQVPLMAALPSAQAAMDAHRGVAAVAEHGLAFLWNLSFAEANKVSWWACLLASFFACMCLVCPCARALLCAGAVDGGPAHCTRGHGCPPKSGGRGRVLAGLLGEPGSC